MLVPMVLSEQLKPAQGLAYNTWLQRIYLGVKVSMPFARPEHRVHQDDNCTWQMSCHIRSEVMTLLVSLMPMAALFLTSHVAIASSKQ